ncbi:related to Probable Xaa-Pro aminopeptidase GLRG_02280 [Cephalotrichum gorgonifer]|uniref:Xaa-Pro aminopeptidase n=1 Tax=Cephalotrichum gorgonifer TaxID=2041049 RepID=A0AAE8N2X7_9PEZI|nr:related to Probable Xaa-Pro aminopeptidase GLRG_02280 [Cephalotrichum gorgonifer]
MAPSDPAAEEAHTEFDFGLDFIDEFDALFINVKGNGEDGFQDDVKVGAEGDVKGDVKMDVTGIKKDVKDEEDDIASLGKYPAKLHAEKVANELYSRHGIKSGLIYLPGEPTRFYEHSDMSPEFRQRRYFYYLSGANFPDCAVTYDLSTSNLILWVPYVEPRQILWFGRTPSPKECLSRFHVDDVRYISELDAYISQNLLSTPSPTLYLLSHSQLPPAVPETYPRVRVDSARLLLCMDSARVVKTDYEVAMIRKANAVSSAAHLRIAKSLLQLTNEREIEAIFRAECALRGAKIQAYSPIAGSGVNASTLHYEDNDQPLEGRELVVLDAGCEWDCYASDITRTLPLSGRFSKEARAIYDIVDKMQTECIEAVRPGLKYYKLHLHAAAVALVGLLRLGVLRGGSVSEIFKAGTVAAFFPHGLGHHIGLETHDVSGPERLLLAGVSVGGGAPGRRARREVITPVMMQSFLPWAATYGGRQRLEENMIVTIEPGIYFCREYLEGNFINHPVHSRFIDKDVLEKYYPVGGVRIEDCILVTADGYENLTSAPKGEEMLRIINGE